MLHGTSKAVIVLALGCVLVGMFGGCTGQPLSRERYDQITTGMTLDEVQDLLGAGSKAASATGDMADMAVGGSTYVWEEGDKTITVVFDKDNKVVSKSQVGLME